MSRLFLPRICHKIQLIFKDHSKTINTANTVITVKRVKSVKGINVRESIIASTEPAGDQNFLHPTSACTFEKHIIGVSEIQNFISF